MAELIFRILGCGSSGGVPRLGGLWGECDSGNPRNRRSRCSLLITRRQGSRETRVLIDSSPDLRQQLLDADVGLLDAVVYTHPHADHVNGLDDLRMIFHNRRSQLPAWADAQTQKALQTRFGYAFIQPEGSPYPPILKMNLLKGPLTIHGEAGEVSLIPFSVTHGAITSKGFRIGALAYLPDVSELLPESWEALRNLDCWIVDALRRTPHPSHTHLEQTLAWVARAAPRRAILTNLHIDMDYQTLLDETPSHVEPAYDGLEIRYGI
ncbi:MAG: MBL fold metallo-hydrolase [Rhodobacteraceae bacterium]|nr:MBL fold metallo-hydrolase [Paracoccaceae bacterium]